MATISNVNGKKITKIKYKGEIFDTGGGDTSNTKYYKYEPKGGTAIPNDGTTISKIYLNINVGSVSAYLKSLGLTLYEMNGFKFYPFLFDSATNNAYLITEDGDIQILNFVDTTQYEFWANGGWQSNIINKNGIIEFSAPITPISEFMGIPVGAENEKIKSIISFDNSISAEKKECSYEDIITSRIDEVESNSNYIHRSAFTHCYGIKNINFPNAKEIGTEAFSYCQSLTNVQLPLLEKVEPSLFFQCLSLKSVCLNCATEINNGAFIFCEELTTLIFPVNQVVNMKDNYRSIIGNTPITDSTTEGFIYVPNNLVEQYKVANNWSNIASKIKPLSELPQEYKDLYNIV